MCVCGGEREEDEGKMVMKKGEDLQQPGSFDTFGSLSPQLN